MLRDFELLTSNPIKLIKIIFLIDFPKIVYAVSRKAIFPYMCWQALPAVCPA